MGQQEPFDANQWARDMLARIDAISDGAVRLVDEYVIDEDEAARKVRKKWWSTVEALATAQRRELAGAVLPYIRRKLQTGMPKDWIEAMDMRMTFEADLDGAQRMPNNIIAQIQQKRD